MVMHPEMDLQELQILVVAVVVVTIPAPQFPIVAVTEVPVL